MIGITVLRAHGGQRGSARNPAPNRQRMSGDRVQRAAMPLTNR
jgi:hypothetical protein